MATPIKAQGTIFKINGVAVAPITDFEISLDGETIDITSLGSFNNWRQRCAGLKEFTFSGELHFIPQESGQVDLLQYYDDQSTTATFTLEFTDSGQTAYSFKGFITNFTISGTVGEVVRGSIEIQGTGPVQDSFTLGGGSDVFTYSSGA